ncbi:MAG TPA: hypothetical protein VK369_13910 [Segetibacter sp.]|nr:hypothetical protein [Segetibacter sp.]
MKFRLILVSCVFITHQNIKAGAAFLPNLTRSRGIATLLTVIYHADLCIEWNGGLVR